MASETDLRLTESGLETEPLGAFLDSLGARTPAPGGGAAASVTGALASSLARMVVSYSVGKKDLSAYRTELEDIGRRLDTARRMMLEFAEEDARAYELVHALSKHEASDPARVEAIERAIQIPLSTAAAGSDLCVLEGLPGITNRYLRSDLAIAAVLAQATVESACWNVEANLSDVEDEARCAALRGQMDGMINEAAARAAKIEQACYSAGDASRQPE